jgi:hypothetical protein
MKKLHSLKISSLTHLEAGQLIKSNLTDVATAGINSATDPLIQNYLTLLTADSAQMDLALIQVKAQQETHNLEVLDMSRDASVRVLRMQLNIYSHSNIPAEVTAYTVLKIPFNAYKTIEKLNYEAENNAIDNFEAELAKPTYATAITTLNLGGLITRMKNDNTAFKSLFSTRSITLAATAHYDAKAIRKTMIANYEAYATYVNSLNNATANLATNAYYLSLYNIVDNIRKYYSDMLARRGSNSNDAPAPVQL